MESELTWRRLETNIKCPLKPPDVCKKGEGIDRREQTISHSAVVITAECNFCGKQASGWGQG